MQHGTFVWNELLTRDVDAAKAFYAAVAGWTYEPKPMALGGTHWIASLTGRPAAGIMQMPAELPPSTPPHWFAYLEVDDVDARVATLGKIGGKLLKGPFDIPGVGRFAIIADASGAALGWSTSVRTD